MMIALFTTIYLIGFLGMTGLILVMLGIGAMFGSYPTKDIWKAFAIGAIWPIVIVWWGIAFVVYKFKG